MAGTPFRAASNCAGVCQAIFSIVLLAVSTRAWSDVDFGPDPRSGIVSDGQPGEDEVQALLDFFASGAAEDAEDDEDEEEGAEVFRGNIHAKVSERFTTWLRALPQEDFDITAADLEAVGLGPHAKASGGAGTPPWAAGPPSGTPASLAEEEEGLPEELFRSPVDLIAFLQVIEVAAAHMEQELNHTGVAAEEDEAARSDEPEAAPRDGTGGSVAHRALFRREAAAGVESRAAAGADAAERAQEAGPSLTPALLSELGSEDDDLVPAMLDLDNAAAFGFNFGSIAKAASSALSGGGGGPLGKLAGLAKTVTKKAADFSNMTKNIEKFATKLLGKKAGQFAAQSYLIYKKQETKDLLARLKACKAGQPFSPEDVVQEEPDADSGAADQLIDAKNAFSVLKYQHILDKGLLVAQAVVTSPACPCMLRAVWPIIRKHWGSVKAMLGKQVASFLKFNQVVFMKLLSKGEEFVAQQVELKVKDCVKDGTCIKKLKKIITNEAYVELATHVYQMKKKTDVDKGKDGLSMTSGDDDDDDDDEDSLLETEGQAGDGDRLLSLLVRRDAESDEECEEDEDCDEGRCALGFCVEEELLETGAIGSEAGEESQDAGDGPPGSAATNAELEERARWWGSTEAGEEKKEEGKEEASGGGWFSGVKSITSALPYTPMTPMNTVAWAMGSNEKKEEKEGENKGGWYSSITNAIPIDNPIAHMKSIASMTPAGYAMKNLKSIASMTPAGYAMKMAQEHFMGNKTKKAAEKAAEEVKERMREDQEKAEKEKAVKLKKSKVEKVLEEERKKKEAEEARKKAEEEEKRAQELLKKTQEEEEKAKKAAQKEQFMSSEELCQMALATQWDQYQVSMAEDIAPVRQQLLSIMTMLSDSMASTQSGALSYIPLVGGPVGELIGFFMVDFSSEMMGNVDAALTTELSKYVRSLMQSDNMTLMCAMALNGVPQKEANLTSVPDAAYPYALEVASHIEAVSKQVSSTVKLLKDFIVLATAP